MKTKAESARDAIATIDAGTWGYARPSPTAEAVKSAWVAIEQINVPVAGYVRMRVAFEQSLPTCPRNANIDRWWQNTEQKAATSVTEVIAAIVRGANVKAWQALEDVLVRDVEYDLRGLSPAVTHLNGPSARREVHLRDARGRVIMQRLYELGPNGQLVLPRSGGKVSNLTVTRSEWIICDGWISHAPSPVRRTGVSLNSGGDRDADLTPSPAGQPQNVSRKI